MADHISPTTRVLLDITDAVRPEKLSWSEFIILASHLPAGTVERIEGALLRSPPGTAIYVEGPATDRVTVKLEAKP